MCCINIIKKKIPFHMKKSKGKYDNKEKKIKVPQAHL